jgi:hypothetical protein
MQNGTLAPLGLSPLTRTTQPSRVGTLPVIAWNFTRGLFRVGTCKLLFHRELRTPLRSAKIVQNEMTLRCVTSVGGREIYPPIVFGSPSGREILDILIKARVEDRSSALRLSKLLSRVSGGTWIALSACSGLRRGCPAALPRAQAHHAHRALRQWTRDVRGIWAVA